MVRELVYAQVSQGIIKGSSGFCPVAVSNGLTADTIRPLWEIAKRQVSERAPFGEVKTFFAHFPIMLQEQKFQLLTRGTWAPPSTKKQPTAESKENDCRWVVHQMLIRQTHSFPAGPAVLLADDSLWIQHWGGKNQLLERRSLEVEPLSPRMGRTWNEIVGDAGWAGLPIESWENHKDTVLICPAELPPSRVIQLLVESQSLIGAEQRWQVPLALFAWYPHKNSSRFWLAAQANSSLAIESLHKKNTVTIDLSARNKSPKGKYIEEGRSGAWIHFGENTPPVDARRRTSPTKRADASSDFVTATDSELSLAPATPRPKFSGPLGTEPKPTGTRGLENSAQGSNSGKGHANQPYGQSKSGPSTTKTGTMSGGQPSSGLTSSRAHLQPKSKSQRPGIPFSQIFRWAKIAISVLLLLGLSYGIWKGAHYLYGLASLIKDVGAETESVPSTTKTPNPPPVAEPPIAKANPVPEPLPPPPKPALTVEQINDALKDAHGNLPVVNWAEMQPGESATLFSIPALDGIHNELAMILDLPRQHLELKFQSDPNRWTLELTELGEAKTLGTLAMVPNVATQKLDFVWKWDRFPTDEEFQMHLKLGRLLVKSQDRRVVQTLTIPLAAPRESVPVAFMPLIREGVWMTPHLETFLPRPEFFRLFQWKVRDCRIVTEGQEADGVWGTSTSDKNRVGIPLDRARLLASVADVLQIDPAKSSSKIDLLRQAVDHYGPFGLDLEFSLSASLDDAHIAQIEVHCETEVVISSSGSDLPSIRLPGNNVNAAQLKEKAYQKLMQETLAGSLSDYFALNRDLSMKAILSGGKGWKNARSEGDQVKTALAGVIFRSIWDAVEGQLQIEWSRENILSDGQPTQFEVPVTQNPPMPIAPTPPS